MAAIFEPLFTKLKPTFNQSQHLSQLSLESDSKVETLSPVSYMSILVNSYLSQILLSLWTQTQCISQTGST